MKRALFWTYDPELPSFRHRSATAVPALEALGWECSIERLPRRRYLRRIHERRAELKTASLLVIAKINLALGEAPWVRRLARKVVFDVDDAIWLGKPRRIGVAPDDSRIRRWKFASTCRAADVVVAGSPFLAGVAGRWAQRVETVPTAVDLERYPESNLDSGRASLLVWIGLAENLCYLDLVRPVVARLCARFPDLALRVVSSEFPDWPECRVERVPWSAETEARALAEADIGLMPLTDDDWSRGKCAFKLVQYMAASLPCVGSPVGANQDMVVPGETGYLPRDESEWDTALASLVESEELRRRMGKAGRDKVARRYCRSDVAARTALLYDGLVEA